MTLEQGYVFGVITLTLVLLALEIWRYDVVALIGMLLLVIPGAITLEEAFAGFGHEAVITIAAVLVLSRGLQNTGLADLFVNWLSIAGDRLIPQLLILCSLVVISSGFMNNIAALAIFIPVAVRIARRSNRSTSVYLLPMAFSSHFGGLLTIIGTPTNMIVSALRVEHVGAPFGMFEFAPVGLAISIIGVLFIALVGWRLIPRQRTGAADRNGFELTDYVTEVRVTEQSELAGKRLHNLKSLTDADVWIVAIERDGEHISSPSGSQKFKSGDTLLLRAESTALREFLFDVQAELQDAKPLKSENEQTNDHTNAWEKLKSRLQSEEIETVEVIINPGSNTVNRTARELELRARYGLNLLAISRSDENVRSSVGSTPLKPNDILLVQASHGNMAETIETLGWIPLAERDIHLQPRNMILGIVIFVTALSLASLNVLPVPVAMTAGAVAMIVSGLLSVHEAYRNIEWPILVLLGAMLSMGAALEHSGGDTLIADQILRASGFLSPVVLLFIIMLVTMLLSDIVNNAAAVVLMSSIAISVARGLGVSTDPFLVAVAVGGAFAFLTPIGHEANVLVFEAGGYEFGDYWRLGLPLELLITSVAVPLVLWLWPL